MVSYLDLNYWKYHNFPFGLTEIKRLKTRTQFSNHILAKQCMTVATALKDKILIIKLQFHVKKIYVFI